MTLKGKSPYLFVDIELSEYLRRVEKMLILKDSGPVSVFLLAAVQQCSLLCIVGE